MTCACHTTGQEVFLPLEQRSVISHITIELPSPKEQGPTAHPVHALMPGEHLGSGTQPRAEQSWGQDPTQHTLIHICLLCSAFRYRQQHLPCSRRPNGVKMQLFHTSSKCPFSLPLNMVNTKILILAKYVAEKYQ